MTRTVTSLPYTELEVADGNFDTSRAPIDRVVIHTMVGTAASAASRFDTYGSQVSAHYGVKLDGGIIHWLEETSTAYHAGAYSMNQRSIGIEHEDNGDYNGTRPDILYETSAKLVRDICRFYSIPIDRTHILKHSEVIPTGCPDALDIDRIVREAVVLTDPTATITQKDLDQLRNDRDHNWNLYQNELTTNMGLTKRLDDVSAKLTECQNKPTGTVTYQVTPTHSSTNSPSLPVQSDVSTTSSTGDPSWVTRIGIFIHNLVIGK